MLAALRGHQPPPHPATCWCWAITGISVSGRAVGWTQVSDMPELLPKWKYQFWTEWPFQGACRLISQPRANWGGESGRGAFWERLHKHRCSSWYLWPLLSSVLWVWGFSTTSAERCGLTSCCAGLVSAGGSEARLRADSAFVLAPYVRDYIRCISPPDSSRACVSWPRGWFGNFRCGLAPRKVANVRMGQRDPWWWREHRAVRVPVTCTARCPSLSPKSHNAPIKLTRGEMQLLDCLLCGCTVRAAILISGWYRGEREKCLE